MEVKVYMCPLRRRYKWSEAGTGRKMKAIWLHQAVKDIGIVCVTQHGVKAKIMPVECNPSQASSGWREGNKSSTGRE